MGYIIELSTGLGLLLVLGIWLGKGRWRLSALALPVIIGAVYGLTKLSGMIYPLQGPADLSSGLWWGSWLPLLLIPALVLGWIALLFHQAAGPSKGE